MRNKYPSKCFFCGKEVLTREGYFQIKYTLPAEIHKLIRGKWVCRCQECKGKGNKNTVLNSKIY